jgi:hypothetical protein
MSAPAVDRRHAPVADVLIGAFATTRQGLLTRNPAGFAVVFPSLTVVTPA